RQSRLFVTLLDNHDVPRFMEEFPDGMDPDVVHERYKLALTALLTLPGIPQLTYGNEVGMYGGADPDNRRMMPDWAFEPEFNEPDHAGFVKKPGVVWAQLQRLIELRRKLPALARGDYEEIWRQSDAKSPNVWAFMRKMEKSDPGAILVALNNGDKSSGPLRLPLRGHFTDGQTLRSIPLEFDAKNGRLDESTKVYEVRDGAIQVELKERSALILEVEPASP
ncbi:MAG: alpha-amylase family glycosyl hydrolase, partial [Chthoniobacterales bacterium]